MRKMGTVALTVLLLAAGITITVPGVTAAYTWTNIAGFELGDSAEGLHEPSPDYGGAITLTDSAILSNAIVGNDGANTWNALVEKCTVTECVSSATIGSNTLGNNYGGHISKLSATTAYGCAAATSSTTLAFAKTTNGGSLWSSISVAATDSKHCDVATWDGSHYALVWSNGTTDDWVVSMSADGGVTWPVTYLVEAEGVLNQQNGVAVVAWSDTSYTAIISDGDTTNFNSCNTTNSGVTWTCSANVISSSETINKERFEDSYYFTWTARNGGGDFAGFGFKNSINDALAGTNAYSVSDGSSAVCTSDVAVFDSNRFAVSFVLCATGASVLAKISESFDGGGSWASETVTTLPFTVASATKFSTGISYASTGQIFVEYQAQYNDNEGGTDADSVQERYYHAYVSSQTNVAAAASATLTGTYQAGSVDDNGTTVIIRSNAGQVFTYSGISLGTALGSDVTDVCNQIDGVFSVGTLVAYLVCDVGGEKDGLRIRTAALGVPSASDFNGCAPGDSAGECQTTIGISGDESFSENGGDCQQEIAEVSAFPISYASQSDISGFNPRHVAWAWSSNTLSGCTGTAGYLGVNMFTQQGGGLETDDRNSIETQFAGTVAEQMCTGVDGSQFYIGAAGTDATTRTFPVTFSIVGTNEELQGSFGTASNMPSLYGQADSIACADSKVAIRNAGFVAVCSRTGSSCVNTAVSDDSDTRAVALSKTLDGGFQYVSYLNGGDYKVAFASNMTAICDLDTTGVSGTHENLKFTSLGPSVFLFTSSNVYRFELGDTCANETFTIPTEGSEGSDPIPTPTTGTLPAQNTNNPIGQAVAFSSEKWGFDTSLMFGLFIILGIGMALSKRTGSVIVVSVGMVIAVGISFKLGLLPEWLLFLIGFVVIAVAGKKLFGGGAEDEAA